MSSSNKRWGFAPSVTIGIDSPTSLTLVLRPPARPQYPDLWRALFPQRGERRAAAGRTDDSTYFGIRNLDEQDIFFDQLTARFDHDFSDKVSIRNLTRWQRVEQNSDTSAPQGVFCLASGFQPLPASPLATTPLACPARDEHGGGAERAQQLLSERPARQCARSGEPAPLQPDRSARRDRQRRVRAYGGGRRRVDQGGLYARSPATCCAPRAARPWRSRR